MLSALFVILSALFVILSEAKDLASRLASRLAFRLGSRLKARPFVAEFTLERSEGLLRVTKKGSPQGDKKVM